MGLKLEITADTPAELVEMVRQFGAIVAHGAADPAEAPKAPRGRPPKAPEADAPAAAPSPPATTLAAEPAAPTPAAAPAASEPAGASAATQTVAVSAPPATAAPTYADFQAAMMATVKAVNAAMVQRVLKESTGQTTPAAVKPEQFATAIAALKAAAANKAAA